MDTVIMLWLLSENPRLNNEIPENMHVPSVAAHKTCVQSEPGVRQCP